MHHLPFPGQLSPLPYGYAVTGVGIAQTSDPLAVFFGCYSDLATIGGLGMVRVSSIGSKQVRTVEKSNGASLNATQKLITPQSSF